MTEKGPGILDWIVAAYNSNSEVILKGVAALIVFAVFVAVGKKIVGSITELMGKFWWVVALAIIAGAVAVTR